jgi:CelD/BcsL family acetyltransferase involved in cellulose biosynthesis
MKRHADDRLEEPLTRVSAALQLVDSEARWQGCLPRLQASLAKHDSPVFCAPHWLEAAWLWRAPKARLRFLLGSADIGCGGFAPLALTPESVLGLPSRTLHFVTVPDTQFADLLALPAAAPAFAAALARHLRERRAEWDRLQLHYLSDRYRNWRLLADALPGAGITVAIEPAGANPFVDLTGSFDAYYGARSRSLKKAVNLSANRLAKAGRISVDWIRDGEDVAAALAETVRVSAISWKQETGNSLDRPGPRAFIERLTANAVRHVQLSLWLLRLDGKVIATEYQLVADGNVHALRSDFDPTYAEASPGTYLNHYLLQRLFGLGLDRYYMGPGSNAYKLRWTDVGEPMFRLTAYSPTARGRLVQWLEVSAGPFTQRWRQRLRRTATRAAEAQQ